MKCTKIILKDRNEILRNNRKQRDENEILLTTGYHGYSYTFSSKTRPHVNARDELVEPQLTIATLIFPEDISYNTGSSMTRWSKKTPRLSSKKRKYASPRNNIFDNQHDSSYAFDTYLDDDILSKNLVETVSEEPNLTYDEYYVSSDIEELILKSQIVNNGIIRKKNSGKKEKSQKRNSRSKTEDIAPKRRNISQETIRVAFSRAPSPKTEQVIRVDVTTNVSFEEMSYLKNILSSNALLNSDCKKHSDGVIADKTRCISPRKFDNNNNEKETNSKNGVAEEDFIVKCQQLALTQKKRLEST